MATRVPPTGTKGVTVITGTAAITGEFSEIVALENGTAFTLLTGAYTLSGNLADLAMVAKTEIKGYFTAITLSGGAVAAYHAA